jgi:hypothetical protein
MHVHYRSIHVLIRWTLSQIQNCYLCLDFVYMCKLNPEPLTLDVFGAKVTSAGLCTLSSSQNPECTPKQLLNHPRLGSELRAYLSVSSQIGLFDWESRV